MSSEYTKDPDSVLDYAWDWSDWLGADTISSHSIVATSGLTVDSSSATTTVVTAWVSGGTIDTDYDLTCRIVTTAGRTEDRTIDIKVRAR